MRKRHGNAALARRAKSNLVQGFLSKHRRVHTHYTLTHSLWLNQVETGSPAPSAT